MAQRETFAAARSSPFVFMARRSISNHLMVLDGILLAHLLDRLGEQVGVAEYVGVLGERSRN